MFCLRFALLVFRRTLAPRACDPVPLIPGLLVLLTAACTVPEPLPVPPDIPYGQGRIWQVDKPGMPPSYLFGTMHVNDPRVFELPEAVETAYLNADIILVESDYRRQFSRKELRQFTDLPKGQSLEELIGESAYRKLRDLIYRHRLRVYNYYRQQPWVSWVALSDRVIDTGKQEETEQPILDHWLVLRARKAGRDVDFLETGLEQWQAFAGIPMDDQVAMLLSAIDGYYDSRVRVDRVAVYVDGNLALSYALWDRYLSNLEPALAQRYTERLLNARNRRMVDRMVPHMERSSAFVAVGALHMPGEEGILSLLERRGYRVTRLY